jgi:hypothetical protein
MLNENLLAVLRSFRLDSEPVSCEPYGCGHINGSFLVVTASGRRYILQRINHNTFRDVAGLMENITAITDFLWKKAEDPRSVMTLVKTRGGESYLYTQAAYWRVVDFIEGTICLQTPETDEDFYQSAIGFGTFQQMLADFPAEKLHETIPNFHNTPDRYRIFRETVERDPMHRASKVREEIAFALERQ